MLCNEIMKRHVFSAKLQTSAADAARLMKQHGIGFLPVCDEDGHPLGVVTDRDLALRVCAENLSAQDVTLSRVMTQSPVSCNAKSTLEQAEAIMLKRKSRRIVLLDDQEKLVGLITLADVLHHQDPFRVAHFVRELTEVRLRHER